MYTSIPAYLREGMATGDTTCHRFWSLWLQGAAVATAALFAGIFTLLADQVLPPIEGLQPRTLLIDTAIFLPAVLLGLVAAVWPARVFLPRLGLGPLVTGLAAPALGTALLCLTSIGLMIVWSGSMHEELVSHPGLTVMAMAMAGLPSMMLAQEMIWPWRDSTAAAALPGSAGPA